MKIHFPRCALSLAVVVACSLTVRAQTDPQPPTTLPPGTPPSGTVEPAVPSPAPTQPMPSTDLAPVPAETVMPPTAPAPAPAKAPKPKPKPQPLPGTPFSGMLTAIDKVHMTITVEHKAKVRTLHASSKARFTKDGKPALFGDGVLGEEVAGYYKKAKGGTLEIVSLRYGPKPVPARRAITVEPGTEQAK